MKRIFLVTTAEGAQVRHPLILEATQKLKKYNPGSLWVETEAGGVMEITQIQRIKGEEITHLPATKNQNYTETLTEFYKHLEATFTIGKVFFNSEQNVDETKIYLNKNKKVATALDFANILSEYLPGIIYADIEGDQDNNVAAEIYNYEGEQVTYKVIDANGLKLTTTLFVFFNNINKTFDPKKLYIRIDDSETQETPPTQEEKVYLFPVDSDTVADWQNLKNKLVEFMPGFIYRDPDTKQIELLEIKAETVTFKVVGEKAKRTDSYSTLFWILYGATNLQSFYFYKTEPDNQDEEKELKEVPFSFAIGDIVHCHYYNFRGQIIKIKDASTKNANLIYIQISDPQTGKTISTQARIDSANSPMPYYLQLIAKFSDYKAIAYKTIFGNINEQRNGKEEKA